MQDTIQIRDYELEEIPLGKGGMGVVYKARHVNLGIYRAVKILYCEPSQLETQKKRFLNEAKLQVELRHPNIVEVLDCFESEGKFHIVMEFVKGETLKKLIERHYQLKEISALDPDFADFSLNEARAVEIIVQCLDALHYAHARNIVHRDIKPANILLTKAQDGRILIKLADFGIAKLTVSDEEKLTKTGTGLGTIHYMAPEQISPQDFGPLGHKADIYAAGVMLFELLTGMIPFGEKGSSEFKIINNKINNTCPKLKECKGTISPVLYKIIEKAIKLNPIDRFQDAAEFKEALLKVKLLKKDDNHAIHNSPLDGELTIAQTTVEFSAAGGLKNKILVTAAIVFFLAIAAFIIFAYNKPDLTTKPAPVSLEHKPSVESSPAPVAAEPETTAVEPTTSPGQDDKPQTPKTPGPVEMEQKRPTKQAKPSKPITTYIKPGDAEIRKK
ncbi:MAG: protein kinase [Nitrospirae bacterium]|nr:protein kinase [Nitrospirota bacterium]